MGSSNHAVLAFGQLREADERIAALTYAIEHLDREVAAQDTLGILRYTADLDRTTAVVYLACLAGVPFDEAIQSLDELTGEPAASLARYATFCGDIAVAASKLGA